jgi:hypothetical protein
VFSPASITSATNYLGTAGANCLGNTFTGFTNPKPFCGNGVQEAGEACDNGALPDACCSNCQLVAGCLCAATQQCCTSAGQFRAAGTVCRAAQHATCDLAETCNGFWGICPMDAVQPIGTACSDNGVSGCSPSQPSYCYSGQCVMSRTNQCREPNSCTSYPTASTLPLSHHPSERSMYLLVLTRSLMSLWWRVLCDVLWSAAGIDTSTNCARVDCSTGTGSFWWTMNADLGTPCGGGATGATQTSSLCVSGTCTLSSTLAAKVCFCHLLLCVCVRSVSFAAHCVWYAFSFNFCM